MPIFYSPDTALNNKNGSISDNSCYARLGISESAFGRRHSVNTISFGFNPYYRYYSGAFNKGRVLKRVSIEKY